MTRERLEQFALKINELNAEFAADIPSADSAIETVLYGIAELIDEDAKANTEPAIVNALLKNSADSIRHAAFDYYASWK